MSKETPHITTAELKIMKVVWQLGSCTVRQTLDALPKDEGSLPAYTTIMTMMKQLAEKGALDVDCDRQPFVYTAAVRRDQVLRQRVSQFLQTVFDGRAEDLVLHLVEEADLSAADIRRMEAKIRRREKTNKRPQSAE
ncbi:MAG: BlaI/MecI/CopY family transcriptional regulator [Phycisphaerales bacterium]|nr:MAG: BlaI/MecI/CopY family transcriptional regulator [Phycisphaerales bacterium]